MKVRSNDYFARARSGTKGLGAVVFAIVFTLSMAGASTAHATINFYDIFKNTDYAQTSDAHPVTPDGYFGVARVESDNTTDLTGGTVTSSSPQSPMALTSVGNGLYVFQTPTLSTKADLDAIFPNSTTYTFNLTGGTFDGQSATLNTPAADVYASSVPFFKNNAFSALQNFNSTSAITLTFDPFTAAAGVDSATTFIDISRVSDGSSVYSTSGPSTLTSATVDANTLAAGTQYDLSIVYSSRITDGTGFGGATGYVAYDVRTDLIFTTAAVPEPTAFLSAAVGGLCVLGYRYRGRKRTV